MQATGTLPEKFKIHKLTGNFVHHWEAHIKPDWLIVWVRNDEAGIVTLVRTGTHADLFLHTGELFAQMHAPLLIHLTSSFSAQKVSQSAERLENSGFCF